MKTPSFEVQFITRLRDHVAGKYPELSFSLPRSVQQPNIVVANARTGNVLWIQVAGGGSANPVPAATIAVLVEMNTAMKDQHDHSRHSELWLVSSAKVLPPWTDILAQEHIHVISSDSVDTALGQLDRRLRALASGD
ncbi:MAG TPA: hypothetical protein VN089_04650 [Duganella sp.]|nr:hypothetical protein [Duganella sp.]